MISVVIPTHNRVDLLKRAIKSVQSQTYKNIEIIVVSDGSTDNTNDYVNKLKQFDKRISYYEYQPAQGANVARNTGVEKAQGEYIAFLDDDDEWLPTKLEKQLKVFSSDKKIGLVYTGIKIIYENERVFYYSIPTKKGELSKNILISNFIGTTSSILVKSSILKKSGCFDLNLKALQDYDLYIRLCQVAEISFTKDVLVNYYNYTNKQQISSNTNKYEDAIKYIEFKYKNLYKKLNHKELIEKKYCDLMLLSNKSLRNGDSHKSIKYCICLLKIHLGLLPIVMIILSFFSYKITLKLRCLKNKIRFL